MPSPTQFFLAALALLVAPIGARAQRGGQQPALDSAWIRANYAKREVRIPMRDGTRLFTSIYTPRDTTRRYPVVMHRTPYSVAPYGADAYVRALGPSGTPSFAQTGYIFVYQDVRGRYYSEGTFVEMTPAIDHKRSPADHDEGSDTYDTVDWLVKNLPTNNKVGVYGISYNGFMAMASCLADHPALVACSPQAPQIDYADGDDDYHNGGFLLGHTFGFYTNFGRGPRTEPGPDKRYPMPRIHDAYQFFLDMGPIGPGSRKILDSATAPFWVDIFAHPNYDEFWKIRDIRPHLRNIKPAVMFVGGFYDAQDILGPFSGYAAIVKQSPGTDVRLVEGPWSHGGWSRGDGNVLGTLRWDTKAGPFYRDSVEFAFFNHYLNGGTLNLPRALMFRTGADKWDRYTEWPPKAAQPRALYLRPGGKLSFDPPSAATGDAGFDAYVSDPMKPVPILDRIHAQGQPAEYMTADQRFAARRTDVLVYQTDVLTQDVTLAGAVSPLLHVATSGTDADFIVKLIDVFPDSAPDWAGDASGFTVAGYQQLVRGEPFRGKFRRSREAPVAFVPNKPDSLRFDMPGINHTFRQGHRIMVQVQSTWFPQIDRNPQTFVPNIFEAKPGDFKAAEMRVYHTPAKPSRVVVGVMP
jgi:putative CocE/NonD family hydrolase